MAAVLKPTSIGTRCCSASMYAASKRSDFQQQQRERLAQVKRLLIAILPEVDDIRFSTPTKAQPTPRVEFQTPYGWVPLRQLGYGYQTLIAWMVDFASRLVERYARPVALIASPPGELARGSARSIPGVNITAAIAAHQDMLNSFGGHPMAAGFSLPEERIPEFHRALSETVAKMTAETQLEPTLPIDAYYP